MGGYELLNGFATPAYQYMEGWEQEMSWVDSIHLYLHIDDIMNEETNLIDGKNWWIIEPMKPKGTTVTEENHKDIVKWVVTDTSVESDWNKEWNFDRHKVNNDGK